MVGAKGDGTRMFTCAARETLRSAFTNKNYKQLTLSNSNCSKNMMNSTGDSGQPCLTPLVILMSSDKP